MEKPAENQPKADAKHVLTARGVTDGKRVLTINLQHIPLLAGLPSQTLARMGQAMTFRSYPKGAYVLHKGDEGTYLLFLLSGRLRVMDLMEDGREVGLSFLLPGDYTGELSIIDGMPRSASVVAAEPSLLAFLHRARAQELIYTQPLVAERVLRRTVAKVRQASGYRMMLGINNAFQRFFTLICQMAAPGPGGLVVIENLPTQQEIAAIINTSRETVSRALHVILKKGIVEKDMRRLIVRNPDALRRMANLDLPREKK
ncbi:MAG: Crp/Fnr family transcriptional regulator [Candidatus Accumulibacter sp.]|jgi:CRP-like cAMP-binding protein|nr:Crp/Fnr family transcriptional regulator [Accumulibacter sp.]